MSPTPAQIDVRKVTVLPRQEWDRIKARLQPVSEQEQNRQSIIREREEAHQKSLKTVQNWSNTIQGQRLAKLQARKIREEALEIENQKIDKEEAQFQQAKRKEAINKAKTLQYYQTDRVKQFHGAMLLSEVLKERDQQVVMRKKISQMLKEREANYDSQFYDIYNNQTNAEEERKQLSLEKTLEVAKYQKQQRGLKAQQLEKELKDDLLLGEAYKEADNAHRLHVKDKQESFRREKKSLMQDIVTQINQKKRLQELDLLQQQEEDEEIRLFDTAKRSLKKKRQEKERQILMAMQEKRQAMVSKMEAEADEYEKELNEKCEKHRLAKEKTEDLLAERKNKKLVRVLADIKQHTEMAIAKRDQQIQEEKERNEEDLRRRITVDNVYMKSEKKKFAKKRADAEDLRVFHAGQINDRAARERNYIDRGMACDQAEQEVLQKEEEEFQKYANEVIDKAQQRGANIYPLLRASKPGAGGGHGPMGKAGVRPSFVSGDHYGVQLPTYQKNSTEEVKSVYGSKDVSHAKKRFGFVW